MKLGRTYTLLVQVDDEGKSDNAVQVNFPLTLQFEVSRNTLASANKGRFQIYNLKESTRRRIYHDRYDTLTYRRIVLRAGYESEQKTATSAQLRAPSGPLDLGLSVDVVKPLPVIFQGNITQAYSYRRGVDWITEIEAFDGMDAILNSQTNLTVPAGYNLRDVIKSVVAGMQNVSPGAVGDFSAGSGGGSRGLSLMGNSWDIVNRVVGNSGVAFVDNEKANVLKKNEYLPNALGLDLLSSDTGMLGTPRRFDNRIDVDLLFEPRLSVGQLAKLRCLEPIFNGVYQVLGITHSGTISGSIGGTATTVVNLLAGTEAFKEPPR